MTAVSFVLLETDNDDDEVKVVEHDVTGSSYSPIGSVIGFNRNEAIEHPSGAVSDACDIMALCNDARLIGNDDTSENVDREATPNAQYTIEGEPTEAALLCLVEKLGVLDKKESDAIPPSVLASQNYNFFANRWDKYATLEFDRKRKSMSVLVTRTNGGTSSESKLLVKGAPGMLLKRCTHIQIRDGRIISLSSDVRAKIENTIKSIGGRALRCIGLAMKDGESLDPNLLRENQQYNEILKDPNKFVDIESGLTFVGLVAIRDPPRHGVKESIDLCKQAGIRVIMITGDAKDTAMAIAKDVHIFHHNDTPKEESMRAYEGREFFALPKSQQLQTLKDGNLVICRAEPKDKQVIVKMLQSLDDVPAMTGKFERIEIHSMHK